MVAKTHKMPLYRSFSTKTHIISGSFAENDLQLEASYGPPPPCMMHIKLMAKEPYKRDDILQKRPIILRSLLIFDTWCQRIFLNSNHRYGVATISMLLKIVGLFCRISSLL